MVEGFIDHHSKNHVVKLVEETAKSARETRSDITVKVGQISVSVKLHIDSIFIDEAQPPQSDPT